MSEAAGTPCDHSICRIRELFCRRCRKARVERLDFLDAGEGVTKRLAPYICQLCWLLSIGAGSLLTRLNHKTLKAIDKLFVQTHWIIVAFERSIRGAMTPPRRLKGHAYGILSHSLSHPHGKAQGNKQ